MPLIVEDGTGRADAESFVSVDDATAYHAARGNVEWAAVTTIAERERALRRATDYVEREFGERFRGAKLRDAQALSWPRAGVPKRGDAGFFWPADEVPLPVVRAVAELAIRAISSDLMPDMAPQTTSQSLGPMSFQFAPGGRQRPRFTAIEAMLAEFLIGGSASAVRVIRA